MPTRGRFVCHVHCLVHDGAVRSSPCRPHHENFGRNLYHMFVLAYFASQSFVLFWVVVFELLRSQMLIPYLFQMVFSYSYVNTNPSWSSSLSCQSFFLTGVSLLKWIRSRQHLQDHLSLLLNVVCVIHLQVAFVFPTLPPFCFSSRTKISSSSIHFIDGKFLHSFPSMFLSGDSHEDSNGASSSSFLVLFFSGGFKSSFVDHTFFLISMSSHTAAPHYHSTSRYLLFRSAQDISKIRVSTLHSFKLFRDWYLIQVI